MTRWIRTSRRFVAVVLSYIFVVILFENVIFLHHSQKIISEKAEKNCENTENFERSFVNQTLNISRAALIAENSTKLNSSSLKPVVNSTEIEKAKPSLVAAVASLQRLARPVAKRKTPAKINPELEKKLQEADDELADRYYRPKPYKVNVYQYDVIVKPKKLCSEKTYMLIIVHSFHPYKERREAIRKTWGMLARGGSWPRETFPTDLLRLAFILGQHKDPGLNDMIREEAEDYDDIIIGNFMDAYVNMTLKSLLGLKYFTEYCSSAKVLLKSDDDMIINLPHLYRTIYKMNMTWSIMGPLNKGSRPYRSGKWKMNKDQFPMRFYPPYESGSAYVIAGDLVPALYELAEYVPPIFIDDVYITGILGKVLNVTHIRMPGFAFWVDKPPTACDINENKKFSGTKMTPPVLLKVWQGVVANTTNCPTPPPAKARTQTKKVSKVT